MDDDVRYVCGTDENHDMTAAVKAACREPKIPFPTGASMLDRERRDSHGTFVRLQCKDEQWCDFPCPPATASVKGIPVPKKEVDRWIAWQAYADPVESMKRIDVYSNWVLGAGAIVVLLASGLVSRTTLPEFHTPAARWLFGAAVAAMGLSWVFISFVKAPRWGSLNRHSPPDYLQSFTRALKWRRLLFAFAASFLGLSLALAALIPLGQTWKRASDPRVVLTYSGTTDSAYSATVSGEGLPPRTPIQVAIRKDAPTGGLLPVQRTLTDAGGSGSAVVEVPAKRRLELPFRIVASWMEFDGDSLRQAADSVSFPLGVPTAERPGVRGSIPD